MAELTQKERLQPSLLDRLTDEEPNNPLESRDKRVLSLRALRKSVLRDLAWLLNANNLDAVENLEEYPEVAHSVVNFGVPDFTGHTASNIDISAIELLIRQAVWDFEPRLIRNTIRIFVHTDEQKMSHNALTFDIEGELWAQPVPEQIYLKTELDLETGSISIRDTHGFGVS